MRLFSPSFIVYILVYWMKTSLEEKILYNDTKVIGDSVVIYVDETIPKNSLISASLASINHTYTKEKNVAHEGRIDSGDEVQTYQKKNHKQIDPSLSKEQTKPRSLEGNRSLEERIYHMKRCGGAGCPYTATWLIHINLFKKTKIWLDSTKMEAASFLIYDAAHFKFQLSDTDAYYVHHMSMFEHILHKKYGFEVAKNKTLILSKAAYNGECSAVQVTNRREFLAIIPFYGGLPPNVTKDLSVKSIGQGNSLVDAGTKALQCMATICSILKYYGHVAIGVTRTEDRELMIQMIDQTNNPKIKERIHIVQFQMNKPANLPFHLMAWAQKYIQWYNCQGSTLFPNPRHPTSSIPSSVTLVTTTVINTSTHSIRRRLAPNKVDKFMDGTSGSKSPRHGHHGPKVTPLAFSDQVYASHDIFANNSEVFKICSINFDRHHIGSPLNPIFHRRSLIHRYDHETYPTGLREKDIYRDDSFFDYKTKTSLFKEIRDSIVSEHIVPINYFYPIRYVYYTENDQTVHYDSMITFEALITASNDTTFFTGKRREKDGSSDPSKYLGTLNRWRECGESGYTLRWPSEHVVRLTN